MSVEPTNSSLSYSKYLYSNSTGWLVVGTLRVHGLAKKTLIHTSSPSILFLLLSLLIMCGQKPNKELTIIIDLVVLLLIPLYRVVVEPARGQVRGGRGGDRSRDDRRGGRYNDK